MQTHSAAGDFSLLGILLFLFSLAAVLALGKWYGFGVEMLLTTLPFNIACFAVLCATPLRLAYAPVAAASAGAMGMLVGLSPVPFLWPQVFAHFGQLVFIYGFFLGAIFGGASGLSAWLLHCAVEHLGGDSGFRLPKDFSVIIALTIVNAIWLSLPFI